MRGAGGDGGGGSALGSVEEEGFGRLEVIEELAQGPADDGRKIEVHVLGHFSLGTVFPVFQHGVGFRVDFFDVVVHVLDEEDVVIERLFVFRIAT